LKRGEQPKNMKNQLRSVLIFKREDPGICPVFPMVNPALGSRVLRHASVEVERR